MQATSRNDTNGLTSFDKFLEATGLSHVTGWRYRKRGWLTTLNIAGRHFMERARAGEFAKEPSRPRRKEEAK
jgi:hypothetical protein